MENFESPVPPVERASVPGDENPTSRALARTPAWLVVLTLALLGAVVWMQRPGDEKPEKAKEAAQGLDVQPPGTSPLILLGKFLLAVKAISPTQVDAIQVVADQMVGWEAGKVPLGKAAVASSANPPKHREHPAPAADRLRDTIIAGEWLDSDELVWRLKDIEQDLSPNSPLVQDVQTLRTIYGIEAEEKEGPDHKDSSAAKQDGPEHADEISPPDEALGREVLTSAAKLVPTTALRGFRDRHGWFAQLAISHGDPKAAVRVKAVEDGERGLIVLTMVAVFVGLAILAGAGLLIFAFIRASGEGWTWRFVPPAVAESRHAEISAENGRRGTDLLSFVWLETLAVFLAGFLALKGVYELMGMWHDRHPGPAPAWFGVAPLLMQWCLLVCIFWPVVRGMSWQRWRGEIGWHSGAGVGKEILAGLGAYLAALPIYVLMAIVIVAFTLISNSFSNSESPLPPDNKIVDLIGSGSPLVIAIFLLLASVWAPIVEESILRGALYRHLRRHWGMGLSVLGSALVFAVMHGYVVQGLFMVGTLGAVFAVMREWRGSLIPSATAHFVHNTMVTALLLFMASLARG